MADTLPVHPGETEGEVVGENKASGGGDKKVNGGDAEGLTIPGREDEARRDQMDWDGRVENPEDAPQDPDEVADPDVRERAEAELDARQKIAELGRVGREGDGGGGGQDKPAGKPRQGDQFTSTQTHQTKK